MPPTTPLRQPTAYFRDRRDPLTPGLGVFVLYLVVEFIAVIWLAYWLLSRAEAAPPGVTRALWDLVPPMLIGFLIVGIVAIAIVTAIMHYWTGGDKTGTIWHTIGVAGWAYAPNLIGLVISLAWIRYELRDHRIVGDEPAQIEAEVERLTGGIGGLVDFGIELAVIAWSVVILAYGVAAVHDIEPSETWPAALFVGLGALMLSFLF